MRLKIDENQSDLGFNWGMSSYLSLLESEIDVKCIGECVKRT